MTRLERQCSCGATFSPLWTEALGPVPADLLCDDCIAREDARRHAAHDVAHSRELRMRRAEIAGLPEGLRDLRFADLTADEGRGETILALQAWSQQGGGMFLTGDHGTGKTHMAATACCEMLLANRKFKWASAPALALKALADFDTSERREAARVLTGTGALVIDDLGQEVTGDFIASALHAAIDSRIQAGAPLLVTSNFTPRELGERYGTRLPSRLAGYCRGFRVQGRDRRLHP